MNTYKINRGASSIWSILVITLSFILVFGGAFALYHFKGRKLSTQHISAAEKIYGLEFTEAERKMILQGLRRRTQAYRTLRKITIDNHIPPALHFSPITPGMTFDTESRPYIFQEDPDIQRPEADAEVAFLSVTQLASLIKTKKITSTELTQLYLKRLKKYGPQLHCVITLTEDLALEQARRADEEIAAGKYRGPLHGIPWGAKDLLATRNYKTTWGAMPYKDQVIDMDATVVQLLEEAGAVLVAKLSMGALAMGDVWFEERTRSPWNPELGSSGSSAGPGAATAAGLVGFSIGTETQGSIVSPSTRCSISGLRPTYGRVSRYGAMALSWSMDKIGPMCRSVEDCALVFDAIYGQDGKDLTLVDLPFNWDPELELKDIRIGYLKPAFEGRYRREQDKETDQSVLELFRSLGVDLIPVELPKLSTSAMGFILSAEAAAAFDELTRSDRDDLLVRQSGGAWPNSFRTSRFIPAVEYIQANRLRTKYMLELAEKMKGIDVFITPSYRGGILSATNLTGHPAVVVPTTVPDGEGATTSITFIGNLYEEAKTLMAAKAYQDATDFHLSHPDLETTLKPKEK
ncbi:amidase [Acidobacteriota bacterium]